VIGKPNKQRSIDLQQAIVNLHNALAGLYALQGDAEGEVRHYNNAVMAAREVGDKERLWGMLHNLAQTYIHARQYEPGLLFLAEAEQVATAIESQEGIGKCTQTRGAYHYYQAIDTRAAGGDAQELLLIAIRHYTLATEIFKKLGDDHWLAAAHADLTEAFVALHNLPAARRHYLEAVNRARLSNFEDVLLQVLNQLAEDHPELALKDLSPRLLRIMEIARTCHVITRDDLENEPGFTYTTIRHDLNRLVELGLLVRIGQTRGIKYTLAA